MFTETLAMLREAYEGKALWVTFKRQSSMRKSSEENKCACRNQE